MFDVKRFSARINTLHSEGIFVDREADYAIYDHDLLMNLAGVDSDPLMIDEWRAVSLRMFVISFDTYDRTEHRVSFLVSAKDEDTALLMAFTEILLYDLDDITFDPECTEICDTGGSCYLLRQNRLIDAPKHRLQSVLRFLDEESDSNSSLTQGETQ